MKEHPKAPRARSVDRFEAKIKTVVGQLTNQYDRLTPNIIRIEGLALFSASNEDSHKATMRIQDDVDGHVVVALQQLIEEFKNGHDIIIDIEYLNALPGDSPCIRRLHGVKIDGIQISAVGYGESYRSCFYVDFNYKKLENIIKPE
jgi:hypothetical protein